MEARITNESGRKVIVDATMSADVADAPVSVEASGLFIIPRWAFEDGAPSGVGSLD